jgi:hypothetical protein
VVPFLMVILTAIALHGWGRRLQSSWAGWLCAAAWMSSPLVAWLAIHVYVDAGLVRSWRSLVDDSVAAAL